MGFGADQVQPRLGQRQEREQGRGRRGCGASDGYGWQLGVDPLERKPLTCARASADIYRTEPTRRRECLYFLAVGHYKLGNFGEARRYNSASQGSLSRVGNGWGC